MNNYLVYTYYVGRALGGAKDYLDGFETIDQALENILPERNRYYQIVDALTMKVVKEGLAMFKDFTPERSDTEDSYRDGSH